MRTNKTILERFEEKYTPEALTGCWLWTGALCGNSGLYGQITVNYRKYLAHRLSYELFIGPIPDGKVVAHHCDNPSCVNPGHLFLATQAENIQDMRTKGRHPGSNPGLTRNKVREIFLSPTGGPRLAKKFGVALSTVYKIKARTLRPLDTADLVTLA